MTELYILTCGCFVLASFCFALAFRDWHFIIIEYLFVALAFAGLWIKDDKDEINQFNKAKERVIYG